VLGVATAASGQSSEGPTAETVTVYSSLPLRGVDSERARAVERGTRLALEEAGGQAGSFNVRYRSLDDSTRRAGTWHPYRESRNARWTASDENAVAYIGAFNSGATALSLPILNEVGVLQVSPTNTVSGLTRDEPGTGPGDPEKYYPAGERTYARVIPRNTIQGAALGLLLQDRGCERAYLLRDGTWEGREIVQSTRRFARRRDIAVVGLGPIHPKAPNYRNLAAAIRDRRADCMLFSGLAANNAVQLFRDVSRAVPHAQLFGGDGLARRAFTDPRRGGLPRRVARKTWITHPALAHSAYPPAGQDFFTRYRARYGTGARRYGIYGYEAMSLVLDAIARAGAEGDQREAVLAAGFATSDRESVLGTYSIDPFGDTTLTDFGVYRIERGRLSWDRVVRP
jgi:branched-chain amino acid transport system substrate-binding protein